MTAASVALCSENRQLEQGKWRNQGVSDNVGAVKHFLSVLTRALRGARHFALVEGSAIPTKARS
jgi:hypothetical protein